MTYKPGEWAWSLEDQQIFMVVETQGLWGDTLVRVWVPAKDAIVRGACRACSSRRLRERRAAPRGCPISRRMPGSSTLSSRKTTSGRPTTRSVHEEVTEYVQEGYNQALTRSGEEE
jgi:hypothetical protein